VGMSVPVCGYVCERYRSTANRSRHRCPHPATRWPPSPKRISLARTGAPPVEYRSDSSADRSLPERFRTASCTPAILVRSLPICPTRGSPRGRTRTCSFRSRVVDQFERTSTDLKFYGENHRSEVKGTRSRGGRSGARVSASSRPTVCFVPPVKCRERHFIAPQFPETSPATS
jgi:hypothetical protein